MDSRRAWRWAKRSIGVGTLLALGVAGAVFFFRPVQVAVIVVTHDERMIEGFDRIIHMVDGRITGN
jgi:hypothetical protein